MKKKLLHFSWKKKENEKKNVLKIYMVDPNKQTQNRMYQHS